MNEVKAKELDSLVLSKVYDKIHPSQRPRMDLISLMRKFYELRQHISTSDKTLTDSDISDIHAYVSKSYEAHPLTSIMRLYLAEKGYAFEVPAYEAPVVVPVIEKVLPIKKKEIVPRERIVKKSKMSERKRITIQEKPISYTNTLSFAVIGDRRNFLIQEAGVEDSYFSKGHWYFLGAYREEDQVSESSLRAACKKQLGVAVSIDDYLGETINTSGIRHRYYACTPKGEMSPRSNVKIVPRADLFKYLDRKVINAWSKDVLCHIFGEKPI